jgi:cytochrome b
MATVKVWDGATRLFHWCLAALVIFQFIIGDIDGFLFVLHIYVGYTILAFVLYRITWGFVGSPRSRFSDFVAAPSVALAHALALIKGHPPRHVGHNPLGGYMIVALIGAILATRCFGPLAVWLVGPGENIFCEYHEFFATLVIALAVLHVLGVVADRLLRPQDKVIQSMVTGDKPVSPEEAAAEPALAPSRRAILVAVPFVAAWLIAFAATNVDDLVSEEEGEDDDDD